MKAIAIGLSLAVVVAACLPPAGTLFRTTLSTPDGAYPLPVALGDQTGLIVEIEPAEPDSAARIEPLVQPDPTDPNAFVVTWLGGACDNDATIAFQRSGSGYALHLEVHDKIGLGCSDLGILRGLRITTSTPVPLNSITASGGG